MVAPLWCFLLTEGFHRFDKLEREGFIFGKLFKHAGDLVVPRPDDVLPVDALYVVAHADHLHPVHHAALLDALPGGKSCKKRKRQKEE